MASPGAGRFAAAPRPRPQRRPSPGRGTIPRRCGAGLVKRARALATATAFWSGLIPPFSLALFPPTSSSPNLSHISALNISDQSLPPSLRRLILSYGRGHVALIREEQRAQGHRARASQGEQAYSQERRGKGSMKGHGAQILFCINQFIAQQQGRGSRGLLAEHAWHLTLYTVATLAATDRSLSLGSSGLADLPCHRAR